MLYIQLYYTNLAAKLTIIVFKSGSSKLSVWPDTTLFSQLAIPFNKPYYIYLHNIYTRIIKCNFYCS